VLGISFLVAGVLHIGVYARKGDGRQMGQLINALVSFALGGIILAGQIWQIPVLAWLSWLLIAMGLALLIVGFVVRSRGTEAEAAQPAAAASVPVQAAARPGPAPVSEPGASATSKPGLAEPAAPTQPATPPGDSSPEGDSNTDMPAA
jgi:hypothetical protein